jgi:hypothetical protein
MTIGGKEVHRISTHTIYLPNKFTLLVQTLNKFFQHFSVKVQHFSGGRIRVGETHLMFLLITNVH